MRPTFGSVIWDYLMEPEDPETQEIIKEDIERIVKTDPRVQLEDINLTILDHTIQAEVKIKYLLLNSTDTLFLEYVSNNTDSE